MDRSAQGRFALIASMVLPVLTLVLALLNLSVLEPAMGGYGPYVSSSFALTFNVVAIAALLGYRRHVLLIREISLQIAATEKQQ